MGFLRKVQKGLKSIGESLNPFKNNKETLVEKERLNILRENIHKLLSDLKETAKTIEEIVIYLMRKGLHVNFSEQKVKHEVITAKKTLQEYKIVDEIDRSRANKKELEVLKSKFKNGVYCPNCYAKITKLPTFTSFKCEYCDTVFLI